MRHIKKKKVYIAGPMRGYFMYNFKAFDDMKTRLILKGFDTTSYVDILRRKGFDETRDFNINKLDPIKTAKLDMEELAHCDAAVFLDGWESSAGAVAKAAMVNLLGILVLDPVTFSAGESTIKVDARMIPVIERLL